MRPLIGNPFDAWRQTSKHVKKLYGGIGDETCGVFVIPASMKDTIRELVVIASCGGGWDHVSVSVARFAQVTPMWTEMSFVKRTFFNDDEWAIEYHPPVSKNISVHDGCLHLWRPQQKEGMQWFLPIPPQWMVA